MTALRQVTAVVATTVLVLVAAAVPAQAGSLSPWWGLSSGARPSALPAEGEGVIVITAENRGDGPTTGRVTISDRLPSGLKATRIQGVAGSDGEFEGKALKCTTLEGVVCKFDNYERINAAGEKETVTVSLRPYEQIEMRITVKVLTAAHSGETNSATVVGGGAAAVSASHVIDVGGTPRFGIEEYSLTPERTDGSIDTQAGSHPFQVTSVVTLNTQTPDSEGRPRAVAMPRDILSDLPTGFIGNPSPFARCTEAQFDETLEVGSQVINACPSESALGVATITFNQPYVLGFDTLRVPIFNMTPRVGEPARFGFDVAGGVAALLDTSLRTGADYGVRISSLQIPELAWILSVKLTFWGVPGASAHDSQRGWYCLNELGGAGACLPSKEASPPPFLVMPTSCGAFESTLRADSWAAEGKEREVAEPVTYRLPQAVDSCNQLPFSPSIKVTPDGTAASTPTGLNVDVHVPQDAILNSESLAESAVRGITVALPPGVAVNPSGADGLLTCSEGLAGFTGFAEPQPGDHMPSFTPALPAPVQQGVNFCADASKIGTVKIVSPLLPKGQNVTGAVYLAAQNENPFGSLVALYLIAEDPVSGTLVKLAGETSLCHTVGETIAGMACQAAGQLVSRFDDNPQLAFEDAELHFFGGERAPLTSPAHCGAYTTEASYTPWSGNGPVHASSTFDVVTGPHQAPCPGASLPFSPSLTGGSVNNNGGAFTPLTTTIGREDGQQDMAQVTLHMPPGLSGMLTGVKLCAERQANEGTCPAESLIGETTVSAGVGSDPVSVKGGRVYITEKYEGAPFGLSIVDPVKAGPFDLEHDTANPAQTPGCDCVVVRARIDVDSSTAALTVTTNGEGEGHAIPHFIDGIPVQIKKVNVLINRPGFTLNPTSCEPLSMTGSIVSDAGASSPVSVPFQVANCAVLRFKPSFRASTSGKPNRKNGESLDVRVSMPRSPQGTLANIAKVKVDLPRQLPSRLGTLQQACLDSVFGVNPAACPVPSRVGIATAMTPILPVPMRGPVYFVSHGARKFPDLVIVLQGYGVTVDLRGETFISKKGLTSTTFRTIPDVPVGTFELHLPQGPYSALFFNGTVCKGKKPLVMPTSLVAQNGMTIHQQTKIAVTDCPGKRKAHRHKAAKHKRRGHR